MFHTIEDVIGTLVEKIGKNDDSCKRCEETTSIGREGGCSMINKGGDFN